VPVRGEVVVCGSRGAAASSGGGLASTTPSIELGFEAMWGDSLPVTVEEVGGGGQIGDGRWCGEAAVAPPRPRAVGGDRGAEEDDAGSREEELGGRRRMTRGRGGGGRRDIGDGPHGGRRRRGHALGRPMVK
jgi:hypothetical protein